jgi:hypothetical protein
MSIWFNVGPDTPSRSTGQHATTTTTAAAAPGRKPSNQPCWDYCLDYRTAGLTPDNWFARNAGMVEIETDSAVDLDDEAREAARQKRKLTGPRPKSGTGARCWRSTSSAMPQWVCVGSSSKSSWPAKTPPKGAAIFVANCLARDSYLLTTHNGVPGWFFRSEIHAARMPP